MGSVDGLVKGIIVRFRKGKWIVIDFGDRDCDFECVVRRRSAT